MKRLIVIRGGGEMATGIALTLHTAGFRVLMLERALPSATRREVTFSDAVYDGKKTVERVTCTFTKNKKEAEKLLKKGEVVMMVDPAATSVADFRPQVLVDAILAHRNLGTSRAMAKHTIALGPGFCAGRDVNAVIETMRGHNMGRIIYEGYSLRSEKETSAEIDVDETREHIIFAPAAGRIESLRSISFLVKKGESIAHIHAGGGIVEVKAPFDGVLRGIIHDGYEVYEGMKIADIHPTMTQGECFTMSDKVRCVGGSVLTAVMHWEAGNFKRHHLLPV